MRSLVLVLACATALAAGCGGSDDGGSEAGDGVCEDVAAPDPRPDGGHTAPTEQLDAGQTYALTFATSCGDFTVTLDQAGAPATSASLVSLARAGFFDDTVFHRIVPGFVIQGGDPTQTGGGGPGYSTVDVPAPDTTYAHGTVAMAKAGSEPPGTAGSQFFVVTAEDAGLPPEYAVVGEVTDGLDVVDAIGKLGDEREQPTQPVVIETVTVGEGG